MNMGAERAEAQPDDGMDRHQAENQQHAGEAEGSPAEWAAPESLWIDEAEDGSDSRRPLAIVLALAALAWIGASVYAMLMAGAPLSLPLVLNWIATLSVPLALLGLVWLLFGRTSRRETALFTTSVTAMRTESAALEQTLGAVAARIDANRAALGEEAARLMALGEEASDRLGRVTHFIARESTELDRKAQALEGAAANARVDIGVLLHDLPRAEEQARLVADAMKQAGLAAHEQAGALEGQLAALVQRGREADDQVGGAAQRLGAHIARIETNAGSAAERLAAAAASLDTAVDNAMERASAAVESTRAGIDAQGGALLAMIEQGRAGFVEAGAEASRSLAERLNEAGARLDGLGAGLSVQDAQSRALVERLNADLGALEGRLAALSEQGATHGDRLGQSVEAVRAAVRQLAGELDSGNARAGDLIDRAHDMAGALDAVSARLGETLPVAFDAVEAQANRTRDTADALVPTVEAAQAAAAMAWDSVNESEASIVRQRAALDALLATLGDGVTAANERLGALGTVIAETDGAAARIVQTSGQELIDALVRVREAAQQAANHAREAIVAVIPQSMDALADASRDAVSEAVTEPVREQIAQMNLVSENAALAARKAAERLTRQLLTIGETAAAIEARIDQARSEREEQESRGLSRRVALLIESLNSTAIDVTKILSNDVTDSAWAAYLKGDRGVFTRRAVRLLESGEAREVARHYEEEPEFREQVSRYVHDFEAMLQRVMADRDGGPIAITLLSSDMGKLYVALAQAIERLRK